MVELNMPPSIPKKQSEKVIKELGIQQQIVLKSCSLIMQVKLAGNKFKSNAGY